MDHQITSTKHTSIKIKTAATFQSMQGRSQVPVITYSPTGAATLQSQFQSRQQQHSKSVCHHQITNSRIPHSSHSSSHGNSSITKVFVITRSPPAASPRCSHSSSHAKSKIHGVRLSSKHKSQEQDLALPLRVFSPYFSL